MSMMPISTSDLYQRYSSAWPFTSLSMPTIRQIYSSNEKYHSPTNHRITRFYIDDILADSKTSTTNNLYSCQSKHHVKG